MTLRLPPLIIASVFATAAGGEAAHHWAYEGAEGPSHWGGTCATWKAQSPIDIQAKLASHKKVPPLVFSYASSPLHIIDNGHSIQVDVDKGSTLSVGGVRFPLVQFHFHKPGEEEIDGHRSAMVAHFVHRDAQGNLAVVAVPIEDGAENHLVATLWRNLPRQKGREETPAGVTINPSDLLPSDRSYFSYVGSLTTPPCTEGVRWFVLKSPVSMSAAEINAFGKLYSGNARPVQPANGREILSD